jgi:hypothetical protein
MTTKRESLPREIYSRDAEIKTLRELLAQSQYWVPSGLVRDRIEKALIPHTALARGIDEILNGDAQGDESLPILIDGGLAYRLEQGTLTCAPLLKDGRIEDNWGEVDFYSIEKEAAQRCLAVKDALRLMEEAS